MDPDDLLQVWSFDDGRIVRLVGPDFTYCLHDAGEPKNVDWLDVRGPMHLPGDMRRHYSCAGLYWKRIA